MFAKIVNLFCSSDRAFPQICSDLFHQLAALSLLFHIFINEMKMLALNMVTTGKTI